MILGPISYIDCLVFTILLIPQLIFSPNVPITELLLCGFQALPFLLIKLPYELIQGRLRAKRDQTPFVQHASPFQDFVIRVVRYAFANFPANIGQVFFSKSVSLPFMRFRMLRHGYFKAPQKWVEIDQNGIRGVLIQHDPKSKPDVIVYYCHGGGFAMGSSHFYLEPLMVLLTLLKPQYKNPAIFALEYSLVPDKQFPTQMTETVAGYEFAMALVDGNASRICVAGDSAGGTLVLSLLLTLAQNQTNSSMIPGYAALLSPWVTLSSSRNQDTRSDFLSAHTLEKYARQYAVNDANLENPIVSPGRCTDMARWQRALPHGIYITYGAEEVFCPDIRDFVRRLRKAGIGVGVQEEPGAVHAWVIASLFLEDSLKERIMGMRELVTAISANIVPA